MRIAPLHKELIDFLNSRGLKRKFLKQKALFEKNPRHPGLNLEVLEPKHLRIWSFRLDRKYRVVFIFRTSALAEVIDINNHYH